MSKEDLGWLSRAACKGSDPGLFTVKDLRLQPGEEGVNTKPRLAERKKFKAAIKICRSCPVQQECGESAEPEDFHWTVRAAKMPGAFNVRGPGRPPSFPTSGLVCDKGHVGRSVMTARNRLRCYACEEERKSNPVEPKNVCVNGHVGMYEREKYVLPGRKTGKRYCRACKLAYRRKSHERSRANRE